MDEQYKDIDGQSLIRLVPIDPVTAITVVSGALSIASSLRSLFGKGDESAEQILKELEVIRRQNDIIISQLSMVLEILENLGVIVQQSVRRELVELIRANIRAVLLRFYEVYHVDIEHPELREHPEQREQAKEKYRELLSVLSQLGRTLASHTYGYGHCHTVGLAMIVEDWMRWRIEEPTPYRRQHIATYLFYFQRALSPSEPGSIGAQLAALYAQSQRLDAVLDAADARISKGFSSQHRDQRQHGNQTITYQVTLKAQGDRYRGYKIDKTEVEISRETTREGGSNAGGSGGGMHFVPDPVDNGDPSIQARLAYWNAVAAVYAGGLNDIRILESAKQACEFYIAHARSVS